jgi:hypothetical protein
MDLTETLEQLRSEKDRLQQAITLLEELPAGHTLKGFLARADAAGNLWEPRSAKWCPRGCSATGPTGARSEGVCGKRLKASLSACLSPGNTAAPSGALSWGLSSPFHTPFTPAAVSLPHARQVCPPKAGAGAVYYEPVRALRNVPATAGCGR